MSVSRRSSGFWIDSSSPARTICHIRRRFTPSASATALYESKTLPAWSLARHQSGDRGEVQLTLHKSVEDALRLDLVQRNATEGATTPRVVQTEARWYGDEELVRLFDATEGERFHALWVLLGTVGIRLGEALGLQWSDLDRQRQTTSVRRTLQRDRRQGKLVLAETKTKSSKRTLRLSSVAAEALKAHQDRQEWDRRQGAQPYSLHHLRRADGPNPHP